LQKKIPNTQELCEQGLVQTVKAQAFYPWPLSMQQMGETTVILAGVSYNRNSDIHSFNKSVI